jgi:hypothetical protein
MPFADRSAAPKLGRSGRGYPLCYNFTRQVDSSIELAESYEAHANELLKVANSNNRVVNQLQSFCSNVYMHDDLAFHVEGDVRTDIQKFTAEMNGILKDGAHPFHRVRQLRIVIIDYKALISSAVLIPCIEFVI